MDEQGELNHPLLSESEWRRVITDLSVTFVWAYDTIAILPEYDDSEAGILPSGQFIRFSEVAEGTSPERYLCDLDDPRFVESVSLERGRVQRFWPFCIATPLQALILAADYHKLTLLAESS